MCVFFFMLTRCELNCCLIVTLDFLFLVFFHLRDTGHLGGDAATALLALCLSFSLLKVGGVMVSVKGGRGGDDVQLAMDGLCDCYEPHIRLETSKKMNIVYRIDESKEKKKDEFRNH